MLRHRLFSHEVAMDTLVAPSPEIDDREPVLSARLPGEPDPESLLAPEAPGPREKLTPEATERLRRKSRVGLLSGVAIVGIVVVAGGGFVLSPYNHLGPVPRRVSSTVHDLAASAGINLNQPFAPSASLANVKLPSQPSAVVVPRYVPTPRDQDLSEILAMRGGPASTTSPAIPVAPPQPAKAAPAPIAVTPGPNPALPVPSAPADYVPHEPGTTIAAASPPPAVLTSAPAPVPPKPAANDITPAVVAAATGHVDLTPEVASESAREHAGEPVPTAQEPPKPAITVTTTAGVPDAATQALHLRAAPMSGQDQVQVLELVTQMAAMVRDLKTQSESLRADFATTAADNKARLADFDRRIDLAEARNAVIAAASAGSPATGATGTPSAPAPATVQPAMAATPVAVTRPDAALSSASPVAAARYRVQAASPGLALLTEVARGGGDGAQIQVTVGDTIPGWGKVKSVSQAGTSWVVATEHGVIQ
jgi:hypothetical protein